MYAMSVKAVIHARMERISETRNTTCFGAFKVGMLPPRKKTWSRTPKRIVLATRCQVGADASAALAGGYNPPLLANFDARQPSDDE